MPFSATDTQSWVEYNNDTYPRDVPFGGGRPEGTGIHPLINAYFSQLYVGRKHDDTIAPMPDPTTGAFPNVVTKIKAIGTDDQGDYWGYINGVKQPLTTTNAGFSAFRGMSNYPKVELQGSPRQVWGIWPYLIAHKYGLDVGVKNNVVVFPMLDQLRKWRWEEHTWRNMGLPGGPKLSVEPGGDKAALWYYGGTYLYQASVGGGFIALTDFKSTHFTTTVATWGSLIALDYSLTLSGRPKREAELLSVDLYNVAQENIKWVLGDDVCAFNPDPKNDGSYTDGNNNPTWPNNPFVGGPAEATNHRAWGWILEMLAYWYVVVGTFSPLPGIHAKSAMMNMVNSLWKMMQQYNMLYTTQGVPLVMNHEGTNADHYECGVNTWFNSRILTGMQLWKNALGGTWPSEGQFDWRADAVMTRLRLCMVYAQTKGEAQLINADVSNVIQGLQCKDAQDPDDDEYSIPGTADMVKGRTIDDWYKNDHSEPLRINFGGQDWAYPVSPYDCVGAYAATAHAQLPAWVLAGGGFTNAELNGLDGTEGNYTTPKKSVHWFYKNRNEFMGNDVNFNITGSAVGAMFWGWRNS